MASTYEISGTFRAIGDSATLSGGSFSGSFTLDDGFFPCTTECSDYLYDAAYAIDIFNASGSKVTTLANTPGSESYLQIATTCADIHGGLRLFFRNSRSSCLQLVMPLTFGGTGSIDFEGANYALVQGNGYAHIEDASVKVVTAGCAD
ncbi:MAG TPA: hypothetical protein VK533_14825 [Sphingomonas sp.]|uniref:hypothetical protein n=1 Tax=Sphingomonas sp. TaxID=28214 RepID=UPI002BB741D2|nr:hypothetical protein [Sphingomonas sp.]HMI20808.1 hypothetical protein [Sphingomonas sp.]